MKASEIARDKRVLLASLVVVALWFLTVEMARRLPFLQTSLSNSVRMFLIFPALLGATVWGAFIHKWAETGKTGYRMAMDKLETSGQRIKQTLGGAIGAILVSWAIAWSSFAVPAWASYYLAREPFAGEFIVVDLKHASWGYTVYLMSSVSRDDVSLFVSRNSFDQRSWKVNDVVCIRGRGSIFGTTVDFMTQKTNGCGT